MRLETQYLLICAALAVGEAFGFAFWMFASYWPAVAFFAVLAAFFCHGLSLRKWWLLPLCLAGLSLSFSVMETRRETLRELSIASRKSALCKLYQIEADPIIQATAKDGTRWVKIPTTLQGIRATIIAPFGPAEDLPRIGEIWECAGWFNAHADANDMRPRKIWVKGKGTYMRRHSSAPDHCVRGTFAAVRHDFSRRMGIGLERAQDVADLNRAILLGERATLPSAVRDIFIKAGTMHVFAISGLHVMVVAELLMVILICCAVPIRFVGLLLIPLLWAYVYLIGMTPSAVRAAGMASIYFAASFFWRRPNAIIAWCVTFLIIHLLDPFKLLDVGCELSFVVMLGILLSLRWVRNFNFGKWESFIVTCAAWLAGTPLAAHVFGRITPGGILANIVLIPTAAVSVVTSALGIFASYLSETLAAHVNNAAALFTRVMVGISWAVAHLPGSNFEVSKWSLRVCLIWYVVCIGIPWVVVLFHSRRRIL